MASSQVSAVTTGQDSGRPRTRQRVTKALPPLEVPDIDQDAAERKRVLNVLAQRRYRERKRQDRLKAKSKEQGYIREEEVQVPNTISIASVVPEEDVELVHRTTSASLSQSQSSTDGGVALSDIDLTGWTAAGDEDLAALLPGLSDMPPVSDFLATEPVPTATDLFSQVGAFPADSMSNPFLSVFESPESFSNLQTSLSSDGASDVDFPDSYLLPVHGLTLLKAFSRISTRIGTDTEDLWNLDGNSVFALGRGTSPDKLPPVWRPTNTQKNIPHHPFFDFLPWPGARDRIIMILSLPDVARPPGARGPMAIANFIYDFEDSAEGVRIYGSDLYDPGSWEVGQVLFERWWFLFDRDIIANSNRWRQIRGAPPLQLKGPEESGDFLSVPS